MTHDELVDAVDKTRKFLVDWADSDRAFTPSSVDAKLAHLDMISDILDTTGVWSRDSHTWNAPAEIMERHVARALKRMGAL